MGMGDDLLFLGKAEEIYKRTGKKIKPKYGTGWSILFDNVEFLSDDGVTVNARDNDGPVDYHVDYYEDRKENQRIIFKPFVPTPFKVRLSDQEISYAKDVINNYKLDKFCIVNPDYKSTFFSHNKNWGFEKYQQLTNRLSEDIQVVRIMPGNNLYNEPHLENAINITEKNIRNSISIMSFSHFGVSYDGLLQHVFGGFNIPAVIIQGGLVNREIMSYNMHLYHTYDHPDTPCGSMTECSHCKEANESITVDDVYASCLKLL